MTRVNAILVGLLFVLPRLVSGQAVSVTKGITVEESLKGYPTFVVFVPAMPDLDGIVPTSMLKRAVEVQLRRAGIDVDVESFTPGTRYPRLLITYGVTKLKSGLVYDAHVQYQTVVQVEVKDDPNNNLIVGTLWSTARIAQVTQPELNRKIGQAVTAMVADFAKLYYTLNPKRDCVADPSSCYTVIP